MAEPRLDEGESEFFVGDEQMYLQDLQLIHYFLTGTIGFSDWGQDSEAPEVIGTRPANLLFFGAGAIMSTTQEQGYNPLTPVQPDPTGWHFGSPRYLQPMEARELATEMKRQGFADLVRVRETLPEKLASETRWSDTPKQVKDLQTIYGRTGRLSGPECRSLHYCCADVMQSMVGSAGER